MSPMAVVTKSNYGITEGVIRQIVDRIVREIHPHKIILFGSYAWGQPSEYSDLDLLVVMNSSLARPDTRAMQIEALFRDLDVPMDVIAYTPEEIESCLKKNNPFIRDIMDRGRLVYARQHELPEEILEFTRKLLSVDQSVS